MKIRQSHLAIHFNLDTVLQTLNFTAQLSLIYVQHLVQQIHEEEFRLSLVEVIVRPNEEEQMMRHSIDDAVHLLEVTLDLKP